MNLIAFRIDSKLHKQLNDYTKKLGRSKGHIIRKAIEEFLGEDPVRRKKILTKYKPIRGGV